LIHFPDSIKEAVLLVPARKCRTTFLIATQRIFDIIALDPSWQGGAYYKHTPLRQAEAERAGNGFAG
jgi:hypothetical protein